MSQCFYSKNKIIVNWFVSQVSQSWCQTTSHLQWQTLAWAPAPHPLVSAWAAQSCLTFPLLSLMRWTCLQSRTRRSKTSLSSSAQGERGHCKPLCQIHPLSFAISLSEYWIHQTLPPITYCNPAWSNLAWEFCMCWSASGKERMGWCSILGTAIVVHMRRYYPPGCFRTRAGQ